MGIAFEDVETEIEGVLGLERGGEGGRDVRTFSQSWLRERPQDSSDDSSSFNGFVSNEGEDSFTRLFPWASADNGYGGSGEITTAEVSPRGTDCNMMATTLSKRAACAVLLLLLFLVQRFPESRPGNIIHACVDGP